MFGPAGGGGIFSPCDGVRGEGGWRSVCIIQLYCAHTHTHTQKITAGNILMRRQDAVG